MVICQLGVGGFVCSPMMRPNERIGSGLATLHVAARPFGLMMRGGGVSGAAAAEQRGAQ